MAPPIATVAAEVEALPCADRSGHHRRLAGGARGEIGGECGSRAERGENGCENDFFHGAQMIPATCLGQEYRTRAGNRVLRTKEIQVVSEFEAHSDGKCDAF